MKSINKVAPGEKSGLEKEKGGLKTSRKNLRPSLVLIVKFISIRLLLLFPFFDLGFFLVTLFFFES